MSVSEILPVWDSGVGLSVLLACVLVAVVGWLCRLAERRLWKQPSWEPPHCPSRPAMGVLLAEENMDKILSKLKLLHPDELRAEILKAGLKCGPITSTTRFIFEKKLAHTLLEQQGFALETLISTDGNATDDHRHNALFVQPSQYSEDRDFGYSVGLNPPIEESMSVRDFVASGSSIDRFFTQTHSNDPPMFYAVCPVYEEIQTRNEKDHIYTDKKEALHVVKTMKGSRFKAFQSREDAEKFARGICDYYPSPSKSSMPLSPVKLASGLVRDGVSAPDVENLNKEKANSFKSPRTQDLTAKLRKAVEKGDLATFSDLIWSNPRYLIGSGDNPTVVQEGCRYNVLHVAAKENQAGISQLLLDALENPEFMRLMYPDDDDIMLQKRIRYIVDLYLNTPDKMGFDTPLHFACKFGNVEVVNVLCSHPDIMKTPRNKYSQTPEEVICERSKHKSAELKAKIREYLKGQFYVPLLRAEDNSSFPIIGIPWSPEQADILSQPRYCGSPKDPLLAVRAFAGPMSPSKVGKDDSAVQLYSVPLCYRLKILEEPGRPRHVTGLDSFIMLEKQIQKEARRELEGKSKKFCNSVSVGAYLDDEEDMSLEEIKNRQNAALKNNLLTSAETIAVPECIMDTTPLPCSPHNDGTKHGYCSPLSNDQILSGECRHPQGLEERMLSPVSNLMAEFDKLSLSELANEESPIKDERGVTQKISQMAVSNDLMDLEPSSSFARTKCSALSQVNQDLSCQSLLDKPLSPSDTELSSSASCSGSCSQQLIMKSPSKTQSNRATFLLGDDPSKLDRDVLLALENVEFDAQKYPSISKWIKTVLSYSSTERQSWPSPAVLSGRNRSQIFGCSSPGGLGFTTPGRSSPILGSPGRYMNTSDYSSPGRYSPAYASHIQLLRLRHFSDHSGL